MIQYFNRKTKKIEVEKVLGDSLVKFAYESILGRFLCALLFKRRWVSKLIGLQQNTRASAKSIPGFIHDYQINMAEFEETPYQTFNEFFIRKFKPGARNFNCSENVFAAGAEARYLAIENLSLFSRFPVKGIEINLKSLLGSETLAKDFLGGTLIIARLCPVDYHRFHFPISCRIEGFKQLHGPLHSVNPIALHHIPQILFQNERHVTLLNSSSKESNFGKVAMIEVGALGVGKIVQRQNYGDQINTVLFDKGQEKGYFLFGGSTVIWVLQQGKIKLADDLRENSSKGIETWIPLGETIGEHQKRTLESGT